MHALHDRCPHRGVPLSLGKEEFPGTVTCAYHGGPTAVRRAVVRGDHRRAGLADLRQGRACAPIRPPRSDSGWSGCSSATARSRTRSTDQLPEELVDPPTCRSAGGSRTATGTGGSTPRTASTKGTPSTCIARRTGASSRPCRRGTRSTSSGTAAGSTGSRTSATGTPSSRASATGPTSAGGRRSPKVTGQVARQHRRQPAARPVHRRAALPRLRLALAPGRAAHRLSPVHPLRVLRADRRRAARRMSA